MKIKKSGFTFWKLFTIGIFAIGIFTIFPILLNAKPESNTSPGMMLQEELIDKDVRKIMEDGKIPGASIVIIKSDGETVFKSFGFANLEKRIPVTSKTLFEIASCSKSFTALGLFLLAEEGKVGLNDVVSKYFPGFHVRYKGKSYEVTINQCLNHISGISGKLFGKIPVGNSPRALLNAVEMTSGSDAVDMPGMRFEYANMNYDIVGAIIEKVSGLSYEKYMAQKVFEPMGMVATLIGAADGNVPNAAVGYKYSFGKPDPFASPVFRGNFPAGLVMTNANDMARWLKCQIGIEETSLKQAIQRSHIPDPSMQGVQVSQDIYVNGWMVIPGNHSWIVHSGANPNFTSYVAINPAKRMAYAIMVNANSRRTGVIANHLMQIMDGKTPAKNPKENDGPLDILGIDRMSTIASYVLGIFLCVVFGFVGFIAFDASRGVRRFESLNLKKLASVGIGICLTLPMLIGVYFIPDATFGMTWEAALAWAPKSFLIALKLLLAFSISVNVLFLISRIFPYKDKDSFGNKYVKLLPFILSMSFVSGMGSAAVLFLISTSFFSPLALKYLIFYFLLALFTSVLGQKIVQTKMTIITNEIVYELRMKLINRIFATRFEKFEKIDSGRIYSTVNDDTETISTSAGLIVGTVSSFVTAIASFVYLSAISLLATAFTLVFAMLLGTFYIMVGKKVRVVMEKMRDTQNVFMKLIEGLVRGFREISMHLNKKIEYEKDVDKSCGEYRQTRIASSLKFVNVNLISNSLILVLMAGVCISFPRLFPEMSLPRLISFIMVLLYMVGPITSIMASFPVFIRVKVSWDRIQKFIAEIPAMEGITNYKEIKSLSHKGEIVESLDAEGIMFNYPGQDGKQGFSVGPIDIHVKKGEILFLVGGNGSGKTTFAKLLTGLYGPHGGKIKINGKEIAGDDYLGEYFSVVFGDFHIFEKLYNVDMETKRDEIEKYLEVLELQGKVDIQKGAFTTINLSGGQKKRMALLQCYLEDCPIYLFDEVAADQDPEFRKFFYRNLLLKMKERGKIIIAITHDDHYFDVADKIIKLDMGKIDEEFRPRELTN